MKTVARHLIAEYYRCDSAVLDDVGRIRSALLRAVERVGATPVGEAFHPFEPEGVSGVVLIAESHFSIHTWPARGYVAIDIFTCGGLDPQPGFELLGQALGARDARVQEILRGLPDDIAASDMILPEDIRIVTETSELRSL